MTLRAYRAWLMQTLTTGKMGSVSQYLHHLASQLDDREADEDSHNCASRQEDTLPGFHLFLWRRQSPEFQMCTGALRLQHLLLVKASDIPMFLIQLVPENNSQHKRVEGAPTGADQRSC